MSYEETNKSVLIFFVIGVVCSCLLLFFSIRFHSFNRQLFSFFSPLQTFGIAVTDYVVAFIQFPTLEAANEKNERMLQGRIAELQFEITQNQRFRKDNETLRALLEYTQKIDYTTAVARVKAFNPATPHAQFTIDIGEDKRIKRDDTVIASTQDRLVLLGRILSVGETSAQVLPLTSQASHVTARTLDGNYIGLISGTGKELVMRYVDAQARNIVSVGTIVVSASESVTLIPGIPIGQVTQIREDKQTLSLRLSIQPYVQYSSLDYVLVIQE